MKNNWLYFLIACFISINCKDQIVKIAEIQNVNPDISNCIKVLHPVWVDEMTSMDYLNDNNELYNGAALHAFIKNMCQDTMIIHISNMGLHLGVQNIYLNDGDGLLGTIDDLTLRKIKLGPADSAYLKMAEHYLHDVENIDSIRLIAYIETGDGDDAERININKEDFYNRSLLFSQYYRILITKNRERVD